MSQTERPRLDDNSSRDVATSTDVQKRDIRASTLYLEAESIQRAIRRPGTGQISDAAEIHASPDGLEAVFAGTVIDAFEGKSTTRVCRVNLQSGEIVTLTSGPNTDRLPKFSPDGRHIAFLSDRHAVGDFQLYLLEAGSGRTLSAPRVNGWVEYLHWSPDGTQILLGIAEHGADVSGAQGAVTSSRSSAEDVPAWAPAVEVGQEAEGWRSAWVYSLATDTVRRVSAAGLNVWEAVWCGNQGLTAVTSPGPGEGLWYSAYLSGIDLAAGSSRILYQPVDQLGWPVASPSGALVAVVEAICSDRWVVAGELRLVDPSGSVRSVNTHNVDVSYTEWRNEHQMLVAGQRGFETVVGIVNMPSGEFIEKWSSSELTTGLRHAVVSGFGRDGDCMLVGESFARAPEIAEIRGSIYRQVASLDRGYGPYASSIQHVERVSWKAPDGLEIQGWVLLPRAGAGPYPLVMAIHGGPVAQWRPTWLGRPASLWVLMLLQRGYAVFLPNPRGSFGRGRDFVRHVLGDMGGADTYDFLSGLDYLVGRGIADERRLGVIGGSYGGYMTLWLTTQSSRFAAAVASSPLSNHVTEHFLSNIPHFVKTFLADDYTNPNGKYFQRSPLMHARKVRTPMLLSCGALDRCTPPEEAAQFHSALREQGAQSVLLTYPREGHGVRSFPTVFDYAARVVGWFEQHLGRSG